MDVDKALDRLCRYKGLATMSMPPYAIFTMLACMQAVLSRPELQKIDVGMESTRSIARSLQGILQDKFPELEPIIESGWASDPAPVEPEIEIGDPQHDGLMKLLVYTAGNQVRVYCDGDVAEIGVALRTAIQNDRSLRSAVIGAAMDFCVAEGIDITKMMADNFPKGYKPAQFEKG